MVKLFSKIGFLGFIISILLAGCDTDIDPSEQAELDEKRILKYIEENQLDAKKHESGLYYVIENEGSGGNPGINSYVNIKREGYFINGEVFSQSSRAGFNLHNEIEGLQIGIPLFKKGGKGKLIIPSALAYGNHETYYNRSLVNKVLIYDIEIIDFR